MFIEPRSSPASLRGQRFIHGTRGARKSQLQEVSIPLTRKQESETVADDDEQGDRSGDKPKNDALSPKNNSELDQNNTPKSINTNIRKRRKSSRRK